MRGVEVRAAETAQADVLAEACRARLRVIREWLGEPLRSWVDRHAV